MCHGGSLEEQGEEGDEKDNIKDEPGMRHTGVKGEYGEDNGHSAPEPHPGNVGFRTKVDIPERK